MRSSRKRSRSDSRRGIASGARPSPSEGRAAGAGRGYPSRGSPTPSRRRGGRESRASPRMPSRSRKRRACCMRPRKSSPADPPGDFGGQQAVDPGRCRLKRRDRLRHLRAAGCRFLREGRSRTICENPGAPTARCACGGGIVRSPARAPPVSLRLAPQDPMGLPAAPRAPSILERAFRGRASSEGGRDAQPGRHAASRRKRSSSRALRPPRDFLPFLLVPRALRRRAWRRGRRPQRARRG